MTVQFPRKSTRSSIKVMPPQLSVNPKLHPPSTEGRTPSSSLGITGLPQCSPKTPLGPGSPPRAVLKIHKHPSSPPLIAPALLLRMPPPLRTSVVQPTGRYPGHTWYSPPPQSPHLSKHALGTLPTAPNRYSPLYRVRRAPSKAPHPLAQRAVPPGPWPYAGVGPQPSGRSVPGL